MPQLRYSISPEVLQQAPGYLRGVLVFTGLDNSQDSSVLQPAMREAEAAARARVPAQITDFPVIAAWREAYRRFGAKPSEHRSAIEALLRRVLKPDQLPRVNALVDIGNLVSVRHLLPAGVHPLRATDTAAIELQLRTARVGDLFMPPDGGGAEAVPVGEVVLARGGQVLTRRWTWRQAAGTRIEMDTRSVFINVDGLPPTDRATVETAMDELQSLIVRHCGGSLVHRTVLDSAHSALEIDLLL